ncbi:MAG: VPLPA-CTERM sorting domain-containing protein [Roseicyclus sp.]
MKFAHYLAAGAVALSASASTASPITTIEWNVAGTSVVWDGTNPDPSPLDVSSILGGDGKIFFSTVLSAEVMDADDTSGPHGGSGSLDDDDPLWTFVDEYSGFDNDFVFEFSGGPQITLGESDPSDLSDRRDLLGGLFEAGEMRFFSQDEDGVTANLGDPGFGIFWQEDNDLVLLAYSDRDAAQDGDFNDLVISVNQSSVNVVPLPAAAWLLLAGLGGLFGLKRVRRTA